MPSDTKRICGPTDETRAPLDENKIKQDREKHVSESINVLLADLVTYIVC